MKELVDSLLALIPFLQRYPLWVKVLFVVWLACSFALVASLVFAKGTLKQPEGGAPPSQQATVSGSTNSNVYQAGRDIIIADPRWENAVAGNNGPLTFQAAAYRGAQYPPGTKVGGIDWKEQFSDVRLDLRNPSEVDVEEIDLLIQTDQSIAGVGQITNIPNVVASPHGETPSFWLEGNDEHGSAVSLPVTPAGTVMTGVWRLYCPKLLRGSELRLTIAAISLNPAIGGRLPDKLFAPRTVPTWIRIAGRYQTSTSTPPRRLQIPPKTFPLE
jgi:hypothetical protein